MGLSGSKYYTPTPTLREDALIRIVLKCKLFPEFGPRRWDVAYFFEGTRAELRAGEKWDEKAPLLLYSKYSGMLTRVFDQFAADAARGMIEEVWGVEIWLDCSPGDYVEYIHEKPSVWKKTIDTVKSVDSPQYDLDKIDIERVMEIIEKKKMKDEPAVAYFQEEINPATFDIKTHAVSSKTATELLVLIHNSPTVRTIHLSSDSKRRWESHWELVSVEKARGVDPLVRIDANVLGKK